MRTVNSSKIEFRAPPQAAAYHNDYTGEFSWDAINRVCSLHRTLDLTVYRDFAAKVQRPSSVDLEGSTLIPYDTFLGSSPRAERSRLCFAH